MSSIELMRQLWWQRYTDSLSMALGKKSFLIRDILTNSRSQQSVQNGNYFASQNCNPKLVEWLIQEQTQQEQKFNKATDFSLSNLINVTQKIPADLSEDKKFVLSSSNHQCNLADIVDPSYIIIPPLVNDLIAFNQSPNDTSKAVPIENNESTMSSLAPQLYHNLYYYAMQQQLSASLKATSFRGINKMTATSTQSAEQKEGGEQRNQGQTGVSVLEKKSVIKTSCKRTKSKTNVNDQQQPTLKKKPVNRVKKQSSQSKATSNNKKFNQIQSSTAVFSQSIKLDVCTKIDLSTDQENEPEQRCDVEELCNCCDLTFEVDKNDQSNEQKDCAAKLLCKKLRRNRTVFTELQLMGLERRFDSQKYLSTPDRADLARALGLTQLQVKTWYQNRRMKWKKQVMQDGCPFPPTKPKGRPKKDSIPTFGIEFTNSILCPIFASHGTASSPSSAIIDRISPNTSSSSIIPFTASNISFNASP